MSARAIVPARILRRWDAQALEQVCQRLLEIEKENEELRYLLTDAEYRAEFWSENAKELAGEDAGLTVEGKLVRLGEAVGA